MPVPVPQGEGGQGRRPGCDGQEQPAPGISGVLDDSRLRLECVDRRQIAEFHAEFGEAGRAGEIRPFLVDQLEDDYGVLNGKGDEAAVDALGAGVEGDAALRLLSPDDQVGDHGLGRAVDLGDDLHLHVGAGDLGPGGAVDEGATDRDEQDGGGGDPLHEPRLPRVVRCTGGPSRGLPFPAPPTEAHWPVARCSRRSGMTT